MVEIIVAVLVVGGLAVLPIAGLIIQVWRDHRGKRRNAQGRCYACGGSGFLLPLAHYKGATFNYCVACFQRQRRMSTMTGLVAAGVLVAGLCAWLIVREL
ncbi:hypothetical protein [Polaromonas aquatica]|uniref:hypothetical protein n=1 Tax=Polaromonas aquatica TaxID=332657 RepID=UPI003D649024